MAWTRSAARSRTAAARTAAARSPEGLAGPSRGQGAPEGSPRVMQQRRHIGAAFGGSGVVQLGKKDYPYGSADSVPHVHVYGPDSHLKILGSRGLKRYNLVQGGKLHAQAAEGLAEAQASGNAELIAVVQSLIDNV